MDGYRVLKPPILPINPKVKGCSKLKWRAIYTNLPVNTIARLSHPQRGDSQDQETFLAPSSDKQTRNYDTECSNHHPSLSTLRSKGLNRSKMKWWAIYTYYIYIVCNHEIKQAMPFTETSSWHSCHNRSLSSNLWMFFTKFYCWTLLN